MPKKMLDKFDDCYICDGLITYEELELGYAISNFKGLSAHRSCLMQVRMLNIISKELKKVNRWLVRHHAIPKERADMIVDSNTKKHIRPFYPKTIQDVLKADVWSCPECSGYWKFRDLLIKFREKLRAG